MFLLFVCTYSVFILGIYEATTDTRLHIDEVKLDDTRNVTPVFLIESEVRALYFLRVQLQIHTRSQCHLVQTGTVVAFTFLDILFLPVVIGLVVSARRTISICIGIVGTANVFICHEMYVAGQCTQIVHDVIDTKVVAVNGFIKIIKIVGVLVFREISNF